MLTMPTLLYGGQSFLVADLGMVNTSSTQAGALAELTLTVKTDGTWEFTVGAGDALSGSGSGSWLLPGGVASDHALRFTPSSQSGAPTITNDASSLTRITTNLAFKIEKVAADASADLLIEIQSYNGSGEVTEFINVAAEGA